VTAAPTLGRLLRAAILIAAAAAAFATLASNVTANARVSADEAAALIRSLWYASGAIKPYSAADPTGAMPLYFYALGAWQSVAGTELAAARYLSVALTVASAAILFVIVRRLTANTQVAAAAVFVFLVTPAAAFFHSVALPVAAVTLIHLLVLLTIVHALGHPRAWTSVVFGLLLAALLLTDRDTIAAVVFLIPLYTVGIGRKRALHGALAVVTLAAGLGSAFLAFGVPWLDVLRWGPLLAPLWQMAGLAPPGLDLIAANAAQPIGAAFAQPGGQLTAMIDSALLPYGAAVLGALLLFAVAGRGLRALWAVPIYLIWLIGARLLTPFAACGDCLIRGLAVEAPIAALGCALTLAMLWRTLRAQGLTASMIVIGGALIVAAANTFAPAAAQRADRQFFPAPMLRPTGPSSVRAELRTVEEFIARNTPAGEALLILHDLPVVPLAATLAGRRIPVQSLAPMAMYRTVKPNAPAAARELTLAAIEAQGYWSDTTLARWLERDIDVVLLQQGLRGLDPDQISPALEQGFDRAGEVTVGGQTLVLYKRKS
jgi:hypothetical protein